MNRLNALLTKRYQLALSPVLAGLSKKTTKEDFTADPSANIMNYVKFTAVMAGSIALKKYLEDQKILPDNL